MIGYVTLGTNNHDAAATFYDALLGSIGAGRFMETDTFIAWAVSQDKPALSIIKPADGGEACVGNGTMVALILDSTDKVDAFHAKALELGGSDEGETGPRGGGGMTFGYVRDLDGNKLAFYATK